MRRTTTKIAPPRRGRTPRVEPLEARALLATITVNTTADTNARDATVSLREAIQLADGTLAIGALTPQERTQVALTPGVNLIKFDLPGGLASYRIAPTSALPAITAATVVDGTSQPGYAGKPIVELVGDAVPTPRVGTKVPAYGLSLASAGVTVQGLVIHGFGNAQVGITGPGGDVVRGDYLGTDVSGTVAKPNPTPADFGEGLDIVSSSHNTIGGTTAADRDVISGNSTGITITAVIADGTYGVGSSDNVIEGDYIGTDVTGTRALLNTGSDITVTGADQGDTIGGLAAGAGNVITGTRGNGINVGSFPDAVGPSTPTGIAILGNSIYGNGGLGIDLFRDGVTPNAPGGRPDFPNHGQNYPAITSATASAGGTRVTATLNGAPKATYRVEFFANPAADPSGYGQGQKFLGASAVTTDTAGNATFTANLPGNLTGQYLSATATSSTGDTSEFARDFRVSTPALAATTTVLTTSPNPVRRTDPITITATVTAPAGRTPTGVVVFSIDGKPQGQGTLRVVGGRARATYTYQPIVYGPNSSSGTNAPPEMFLTPGRHVITATYQGDRSFAPSTAAPATQTVTQAYPTLLGLTTTPNQPVPGKPFTITAAVEADATPPGSVTLTFNGQTRTLPLVPNRNGMGATATLAVPGLPGGHYSIAASFKGDAIFSPAAATDTVLVSRGLPSSLRVTVSPTTVAVGQPFTVTAVVGATSGGGTPTGTVTFSSSMGYNATVPIRLVGGVATATATFSALDLTGPNSFVPYYSGDGTFKPNTSGPVSMTIVKAAPAPPRVDGLHRFGTGNQPTTLVLNFTAPLEVPHTQDVTNYVLTGPLDAAGHGAVIPIASAVYDAKAGTVTLTTAHPLSDDVQALYHLVVRGGIGGLRGATGLRLAGTGGVAGTSYAATFRGAGLPSSSFKNP